MSSSPSSSSPESPRSLPPVQPPTAGFLVQLFLAPLLIVVVIVMVWLLFSWLAHMGTNPRDLVRDIGRMNNASWQRAYNLAEILRKPGNEALKQDKQLALELAETLDKLRAGRPERKRDAATETDEQRREHKDQLYENRVKLEMFLCHVLGEFSVTDGLPALINAAAPDDSNDPNGFAVRSAAIQAIAVQASHVDPQVLQQNEALLKVLIETSKERGEGEFAREEYAKLRSAAAYALGMIGGHEAVDRLTQMLDDGDANTRFNAATGLARQGDIRALPVLEEMLDPTSDVALSDPDATRPEDINTGRAWKRALVVSNGIRAAKLLVQKHPDADYSSLVAAIDKLLSGDVNQKIKLDAKDLKITLNNQAAAQRK